MTKEKNTIERYLPFIYFILGFGIFMSTRYSLIVPSFRLAFLIAPIFILRFIRMLPAKKGIWLTLLGFLLSFNIALWGLFKLDSASQTIILGLVRSSMFAIAWFLPFMVDRLVFPKFKGKGILSTLTFPIVSTAVFFIITLEGPFDDGSGTTSTFSFNYGTLIFEQVRSLFGIWILVFIHSWLFSTVNYLWENKLKWEKIKKPAIAYVLVFLLVFVFGIIKTSSFKEIKKDTVKVAAAVLIPEDGKAVPMSKFFDTKTTYPFEKTLSRIEKMTNEAAKNDAKIVSFQEYAMVISENEVARLKEECRRIAIKNNVYLSLTYAYFAKEGKGKNIQIFINPDGEIELDYAKRFLLGIGAFGETGVFKKGAEIIQSTETPYGKVAICICRDAGFPSYMRQAAKANVDIMLSPSYDWPKSWSAWYLQASIENGFSFVRPTYNGYSYAADFHGKQLVHMESEKTKTGIMYADIPTKGIKTLYSKIGNLLGWLAVIGMFVLIFSPKRLLRTENK